MYICKDPVCDPDCDFCWFCGHDDWGRPTLCLIDESHNVVGDYCDDFKCRLHEEEPQMLRMLRMEIVVRKPTESEIAEYSKKPTWGCDVSEFDWHYDDKETCILIEGEVTVDYNGKSVSFGAGDYVEFPAGLSCVWKVTKPVKKHYEFG